MIFHAFLKAKEVVIFRSMKSGSWEFSILEHTRRMPVVSCGEVKVPGNNEWAQALASARGGGRPALSRQCPACPVAGLQRAVEAA